MMADKNGKPELFKCPRTGRVADLQVPVSRTTPPKPLSHMADDNGGARLRKKVEVPYENDQLANAYRRN